MRKMKRLKKAILVGSAIAAGVAIAGISSDFESDKTGWTGGVTNAPAVPLASAPAGFPISNVTHTTVLSIDGEASCSNTTGTANGKAQINFLAFITEPSDELPTDNMSDVQIAFAAGTTASDNAVPLMLYCKGKTGTDVPSWQDTGATLTTNAWHHIQLLFDYAGGVCQVCVDGVPVVSSIGRLTASDTTNDGSWYVLASSPASTSSVASLTMYGTAEIDDVVVQEGASIKFIGNASATIGGTAMSIKYETLAKFGVNETTITTAKIGSGNNNLTVAQCLQCGLEPTTNVAFKVESASLASNGELELVFPGSITALNGFTPQYQIEWVDKDQVSTPALTIEADGKVKATVTVPAGLDTLNVLKYRLKAVAPTATAAQ